VLSGPVEVVAGVVDSTVIFEGPVVDVDDVVEQRVELERVCVYFDYDKSELRWDARDRLGGIIGSLIGRRVVVVGHCDERGSEEYNLGLGERRALAVRWWLVNNGLRADDIEVRSEGEGNLVRLGCEDEECHQENRRVEVK
jgi:peptidoglycan-associated lipoprotein